MVEFKKSAQALFLENYGNLLQMGYTPQEAHLKASRDWLEVSAELNSHRIDISAELLLERVNEEGNSLLSDKTANLDRLKKLKAVRLTLMDLLDMEDKT